MNIKVYVYTLGCKVNSVESEGITDIFLKEGYEIVNNHTLADIIIVNTCTVTNQADQKNRKMIHRFHKENAQAIIIVMGCYSQVKSEEVSKIDGVNIVLGSVDKEKIINYINEYKETGKQIIEIKDVRKVNEFDNLKTLTFNRHTRASLKIQDGCNNFCTYCIIPYARGKLRSKAKDLVLDEARSLVSNGYKEIVLNGIHTGGYGLDLDNYTFTDLVKDLTKIDGLKRLRISSIEMHEITDEILDLIKNNNVVVNHLHIPIQSGSDSVLKAMNRKYNKEEFIEKIEHIKRIVPGIAITTDVIVGFPGETNENFNETVETIKKVGFMELHVFPYSRRDNTKAALMEDQIPGDIKKTRVNVLLNLSNELKEEYLKEQKNDKLSVLFEKYQDGYNYGHSTNYIYGKLKSLEDLSNEIREVRIEKIDLETSLFSLSE